MAQLATVLSNDWLTSCRGGATYKTTIYESAAGFEARNGIWATPRRSFSLTFTGYASDLADIVDLFDEAKGREQSFLWTPPGGTQGSYRFGSDELSNETRATQVPGEFISVISVTVIEVIYA